MRAVQFDAYGGPEMLQLRDISPPQPGPSDVVIDVHAASLNPIDWKLRSGLLKAVPLTFPSIPGRDGAGYIRATGSEADAALLNNRVCFFAPRGMGTWAEQIAIPASNVVTMPASVSMTEAAGLPLAGLSAWIGLVETAQIAPGQRVLIHAGAGGVGSLAIQIARARGADVAATCSERNADFVASLGAQTVIAYDRAPFESQIRDVDVVFDLMGGDVHRRSYDVLKRGGIMVCLQAEPYVDQSAEYGVTVKMAPVVPRQDALAELVALAAAGKLRVPVEKTLPFSEFRAAHELSATGHMRGKLVMLVRPPEQAAPQ